jgi:Uma2 family endonuclease
MIGISGALVDRALVDDDALIELSHALRPSRVERLEGRLLVSPGTGGETGRRNSRLTRLLDEFAEAHGYVSFDSSTGFRMPNGDAPSADGALLESARWEALTSDQRRTLPPIVPDVVVELRSESDRSRSSIVAKCERWFGYGVGCVVLLDPFEATLRIWGAAPASFPDLSSTLHL